MERKQVFTATTGSYLTTALETAQVVIPSFMWLKHVACRSAAADLPRKRPTVQQCPGHLLTPLAPISISGLAEGAICSKCSPVPVNCVLCGVYMVALQRHPEKAINQLRPQSESHRAHLRNTLGIIISEQMINDCTGKQEACCTGWEIIPHTSLKLHKPGSYL